MNHQKVSFIKSFIRIVGCIFLMYGQLRTAGMIIILAEMLGITEELI